MQNLKAGLYSHYMFSVEIGTIPRGQKELRAYT